MSFIILPSYIRKTTSCIVWNPIYNFGIMKIKNTHYQVHHKLPRESEKNKRTIFENPIRKKKSIKFKHQEYPHWTISQKREWAYNSGMRTRRRSCRIRAPAVDIFYQVSQLFACRLLAEHEPVTVRERERFISRENDEKWEGKWGFNFQFSPFIQSKKKMWALSENMPHSVNLFFF